MVESVYLDAISERYDLYLEEWANEEMIFDLQGYDYPMVFSVKSTGNMIFKDISLGNDEFYLFSHYDSIPPLEEMAAKTLSKLAVEVTRLLRVQITDDNVEFWEATLNFLQNISPDSDVINQGTRRWLYLPFRSALAEDDDGDLELAGDSHTSAVVAYPTLERLLRSRIDEISLDGEINQNNSIKNYSSGEYYDEGELCSRLLDLLIHFEETADEQLKERLEDFRSEISIFSEKDPGKEWGMIYNWRNSTAHGERFWYIQYGIVLNLICMIIWHIADTEEIEMKE